MKKVFNKKTFGIITAILFMVILSYWASNSIPKAESSAPPGMQTIWATSSIIALSNTASRNLFASSTCISRTITTSSTPIRIKFGDHANFNLSANNGHLQAASTTVTYDGAAYGCGLWTGFTVQDSDTLGDPAEGAAITEFGGFR